MPKLVVALALILLALPVHAAQPWEGLWLRSDLACTDETAEGQGVRMTRTDIQGALYVCRIIGTRSTARNAWTLTMRCTEGGAPENVVYMLTLTNAQTLMLRDRSGAQEELTRCEPRSEASRSLIQNRWKVSVCEGAACDATLTQWHNLDTASAWALARHNADDIEKACGASTAAQACARQMMAKPEVRIAANCEEGSAKIGGSSFKITDAAREGALRHAELSGYWDTSRPYAVPQRGTIAMLATWFRHLCPQKARDWNMKAAN